MTQLQIRGFGHHGEGVGSDNGYTLFVEDALPGETVEVEITEKHKTYGKAKLLRVLEPSPDRVEPICPLFGRCGGCQLMHLSYEKQLEMKRQKVVDALKRIGKLDVPVLPCNPSPTPLAYRNKIQMPCVDGKLGLYARNSHNLVAVDKCYIHCDLGETIYAQIKHLVAALPIRHLLIKSAINRNEALVILVTKEERIPKEIGEKILSLCPQVKGVLNNLHEGRENVILGPHFDLVAGKESIEETICDLTFAISGASFFQVNTHQAENLYKRALELADIRGTETVLDAYCGVGTLSLLFAKKAKAVIGVEIVPQAIENAKENAKRNHIKNASFHTNNAEKFIHTQKNIDLILLNPPRKGCEKSFLDGVIKLAPKTAIYISCDPATLARDLAILSSHYVIESVEPFDMFPQTAHVETLVKIRKIR